MPHGAVIVVIAVLVLFGMYRRIRRTIGFQKFMKGRMITRMTLFAIIGVMFLAAGYLRPTVYIYDVIGILFGAVIAYFATRTTSFEWRKDAWYYRPNPWIGALLIVLFIGRIAYRLYQDYALFSAGAASANRQLAQQNQFATYSHDPSTTIILFTLITYYLVYYIFLIGRERHLEVEGRESAG